MIGREGKDDPIPETQANFTVMILQSISGTAIFRLLVGGAGGPGGRRQVHGAL
jgi:hypothetical protein